MGMQLKEMLLGIPVLVFILWVFAAPLPQDRITRACEPVNWVGNVATSTTAISSDGHTATAVKWSDKLNYSCKYMVWRLFYQDDYNKAMAAGLVPGAAQAQTVMQAAGTAQQPAQGTAPATNAKPADGAKPVDAAQAQQATKAGAK